MVNLGAPERLAQHAAPDLGCIQPLVRHPVGIEAVAVLRRVDRGVRREDVDPARARDQLLLGIALDRLPAVVRGGRQCDVPGRVVRAADDARVVVRGATHVPELELLERHHVMTGTRQPVSGRRPDPAQPDDRDIELAHAATVPGRQPVPGTPCAS